MPFPLFLIPRKRKIRKMEKTKPQISILVPVFNEEKTILKILKKLSDIRKWGYSFEIIVINDGSKDNTSKILSENSAFIDKYVNNETNFGKGYSVKKGLEISSIETIYEVGKHHEYREKLLPAYVINYTSDENLKAYISIDNAKFQTVRHRDWRWFDFLWMTHTMDYEGRDDFNNTVLRIFSLLGLITVISGFSLWFVSSPTVRKLLK